MKPVESLRVGTWNLHDGGLDDRLWIQMGLLDAQRLDLIGLQEARWGPLSGRLLHRVAHRLGMSGRFRVPSNHHGCDLVMLVREHADLQVLEERHDTSGAWWHALGNLRLQVGGIGPVEFLNTHLAPSQPSRRESEGEAFGLFKNSPAIAVGDFNAVAATCDDHDATGVEAGHAAAKLDRRAARAIERAGFQDAAAIAGDGGIEADRTPTVGHTKADQLAYRCDRILFNNLPVSAVAYEVIPAVLAPGTPDQKWLSDHHLVVAEVHFRTEADS